MKRRMGLAGVVRAVDLQAGGGLVGYGECELVACNDGDVNRRYLAVVFCGGDFAGGVRHQANSFKVQHF